MKFPVLWLSFVIVWAGTGKVELGVPFAHHLALLCKISREEKK